MYHSQSVDLTVWEDFTISNQLFALELTTVHYEDINDNDRRVKFLWKALENFTNGKTFFSCNPFY